jgi:hypothetical protein
LRQALCALLDDDAKWPMEALIQVANIMEVGAAGARTTVCGYTRTFRGVGQHVRSSPKTGHSNADVRYRADFVRFTPKSRRGSGRPRESEVEHPAGIWKRKIGVIYQGSIQ